MYKCDRLECEEAYIGESARTFGERLKEHLRASPSIEAHASTSGHHTKLVSFSIVGRESHIIHRTIKEAMLITHPSVGTLASANCATYGMRSCVASWPQIDSLPSLTRPLYKTHNTSQPAIQGAHILCPHHQLLIGIGSHNITNWCLGANTLASGTLLFT